MTHPKSEPVSAGPDRRGNEFRERSFTNKERNLLLRCEEYLSPHWIVGAEGISSSSLVRTAKAARGSPQFWTTSLISVLLKKPKRTPTEVAVGFSDCLEKGGESPVSYSRKEFKHSHDVLR
jgi:hypothetical protein